MSAILIKADAFAAIDPESAEWLEALDSMPVRLSPEPPTITVDDVGYVVWSHPMLDPESAAAVIALFDPADVLTELPYVEPEPVEPEPVEPVHVEPEPTIEDRLTAAEDAIDTLILDRLVWGD